MPGIETTAPIGSGVVGVRWSAVSRRMAALVGSGGSFFTRCSRRNAPSALARGGMLRRGGDTSNFTAFVTTWPNVGHAKPNVKQAMEATAVSRLALLMFQAPYIWPIYGRDLSSRRVA